VMRINALTFNRAALTAFFEANWEVLGEAVQSVMRAAGLQGVPGMENPYETLKELTRGKRIDQADLQEFVSGLGLPEDRPELLKALTPATYVGVAAQLAEAEISDWKAFSEA